MGCHESLFPHVFRVSLAPFRVDKDRSGAISMDELQQALANGELALLYPR